MNLYTLLLVVLVLVVIGALPTWNHSRTWGYGPSGGILGVVIVVVLIMFFLGRFR